MDAFQMTNFFLDYLNNLVYILILHMVYTIYYIYCTILSNASSVNNCWCCRMYFHYIYKTSINIIFFIKVTVNYHVINFYINLYLIYKVSFHFFQNFITCKITSYCFNSKVSPFLKFNILLVKQIFEHSVLYFWTFKFFIWSAKLPRPN